MATLMAQILDSDRANHARRQKIGAALIGFGLAAIMAAAWPSHDVWRTQWYLTLMLLAVAAMIAYRPPARLKIAVLGCFIVLISCLNTWNPTTEYSIEIVHRLDIMSGRALIAFGFCAGIALFLPAHLRRAAIDAICWAGMADAVMILFRWFNVGYADGFLRNASMDATFVAMSIFPLAWRDERKDPGALTWAITGLGAAAIMVAGGRAALIGLGAGLIAYLWALTPRRHGLGQKLVMAWIIGLPFTVLSFWKRPLFDTTGRWDIWSLVVRAMRDHQDWPWIRGSGAGSAEILVMAFQEAYQFTYAGFIWVHNEWLQILMEYGLLGLACAVIVYAQAVSRARRAWRSEWLVASLAILGVVSFVQMPLRYLPTAMLTCLLIRDALDSLYLGDQRR